MKQDDDMDARRTGAYARQPIGETPDPPGDPVTAGLQRLFAAVAEEPIPDEFLALLDEIEKRAADVPGAGLAAAGGAGARAARAFGGEGGIGQAGEAK